MQPDAAGRPLLTLAIPTYNRAGYLRKLLETLLPQVAASPQVELLISDNASTDETPQVVAEFIARGLPCRSNRNATNIEADPNFLLCYEQARGKFVWIFGDDDILLPGSLQFVLSRLERGAYDIVYLQPFGFVHEVNERGQQNANPRVFEYDSAKAWLHNVGLRGDAIMLSAVIVNKDLIEAQPHPDFREGYETNLLQMGWVFTALKRMRRGLVIERGLFAVSEQAPRRGFDMLRVFGLNWASAVKLFLSPDETLMQAALDHQLTSWFPTNWYGHRRVSKTPLTKESLHQMRAVYGNHWRFWVFAWPLLTWPELTAGGWLFSLRLWRKADLAMQRAFGRQAA